MPGDHLIPGPSRYAIHDGLTSPGRLYGPVKRAIRSVSITTANPAPTGSSADYITGHFAFGSPRAAACSATSTTQNRAFCQPVDRNMPAPPSGRIFGLRHGPDWNNIKLN
jgi:hypothetical protein